MMMRPVYVAVLAVVAAVSAHAGHHDDVAMPSVVHPPGGSVQQQAALNKKLGGLGHGFSDDENSQLTYEDMGAHAADDTDEVSSKAACCQESGVEKRDVIDRISAALHDVAESEPMAEDDDEIIQADKPAEDVQKASFAPDMAKAASVTAAVEDPCKNDTQPAEEDDELYLDCHDDDADLYDEDDDVSQMNDEDWVAYYITHMIEEHPDDVQDPKSTPHFAELQRLMHGKDIAAFLPDAMKVLQENQQLWETFQHKSETHGEDDEIQHYLQSLTPTFVSQIADPDARQHAIELQAAMQVDNIAESDVHDALSILERNPKLRAAILHDAATDDLDAAAHDPQIEMLLNFQMLSNFLEEMTTPGRLAAINDPQYLESFDQLQRCMPGMDISESIDEALHILDREQELAANLRLDAEHYYKTAKGSERGRYENHHDDDEEDQHPGVSDEQVLEFFLDYMTPETIKEIDDLEIAEILTKLQSQTPDNNIPESYQEVMMMLNANDDLRSKLLPFARKYSPHLLNDTQCLKRYLAMLSERRLKVINDADLWDHVQALRSLMPGKEITKHVDEAFAILGQHPVLKAALLKDSEYKGHCRHTFDLEAMFQQLQLGGASEDQAESEPSRKKRKALM